jgi:hypothetical protein
MTAGQEWTYPALDRPTLRFDGKRRQTPGFRLDPYEPPMVPKLGLYCVSLFDSANEYVELPGKVEFTLQPIVLMPMESGDRGRII